MPQEKILRCEGCGITYNFWVMTEEPCEDSGDCHDWERQNGEPQGDYRVTAEGDRVWAIGGFISYD